jgi:hypothetical protein
MSFRSRGRDRIIGAAADDSGMTIDSAGHALFALGQGPARLSSHAIVATRA